MPSSRLQDSKIKFISGDDDLDLELEEATPLVSTRKQNSFRSIVEKNSSDKLADSSAIQAEGFKNSRKSIFEQFYQQQQKTTRIERVNLERRQGFQVPPLALEISQRSQSDQPKFALKKKWSKGLKTRMHGKDTIRWRGKLHPIFVERPTSEPKKLKFNSTFIKTQKTMLGNRKNVKTPLIIDSFESSSSSSSCNTCKQNKE